MARYAVDGVLLDYIRWWWGAGGNPEWSFATAEQVSDVVARVYAAIGGRAPLGACVGASDEDEQVCLRYWRTWMADGYLDTAIPMCYESSVDRLKIRLAWLSATGFARNRICVGLSGCKYPLDVATPLTPEEFTSYIVACRAAGYDDLAFFDWQMCELLAGIMAAYAPVIGKGGFQRIATSSKAGKAIQLSVDGKLVSIDRATLPATVEAIRAELERQAGGALSGVFFHFNRDGSLAIAVGKEPDPWFEDKQHVPSVRSHV
jgi:hypothetical protein